jgi:hypothetical protein
MSLKVTRSLLFIVLIALLVACGKQAGGVVVQPGAGETPVPAGPSATPIYTLPASITLVPKLVLMPNAQVEGEVLRISGNGPYTSAPFQLEGQRYLRINWEQYSNGKFTLYIVNLDPSMKFTPYGEVNFDLWPGPDAGSSDYEFIAGKYVISIKDSTGPWEVWLETLTIKQ